MEISRVVSGFEIVNCKNLKKGPGKRTYIISVADQQFFSDGFCYL